MSEQAGKLAQFIQELRNRRVFRVTAVYLGVGYAILEASSIITPTLGLPDVIVKIILGLLVTGLPIAIVLAWMFQFTPEGIRRSPKTGEKQSPDQKPLTSNGIIIILLLIIIVLMAFPRYRDEPEKSQVTLEYARSETKSIAVLPFTPFANNEEDQLFADGVHDDILTQLSKIGDLKVISRTSVMQYKGTTKLIPDIAKELGVAHVLEGSVRRSGDQIRIVAQLIKAVSDEHLWAETFDRKYADIFTIQTEVAKKIAVAMQATLTPSEQAYIEENPTENLNAYNFYMQGKLSFEAFAGILTELHQIEKAISFYKQAIDLDPSYLLAYTGLVEAHVMLVNNRSGVSEDNISLAAEYLSRAIELNPTHPSVYKARGLFAYYTEWDYEKALENFNNALKGSPNDSDVLSYMAAVVRRQGKFEESRQLYKQAIAINPRSASLIYNASSTSAYLHEWEEERMYLDLLVALEADDSYWKGSIATNMFNQTGNIDAALKYLYAIDDKDNLVDNFENLYYLLYYKRDLDEIRKLLAINSASDFYPNYRMYGQAELMMGNMEKAHSYFDTLKTEANEQLKRVPNDPTTLGYLALAQVGLGDIKAGILTAEKAVKLKPITDDAMIGARSMWLLLDVYSQAKDKEAALNLLERLLPLPSDISLNDVKFDQVYDFIRDEPRFKALIKKYDKRSA